MTYTYPAEVVYKRNAENRRLMEERDELLAEVERLRQIERIARKDARHPEDGGSRAMWALLYPNDTEEAADE